MNGRGIPPAPVWRIPPRAVRRRWLLIATAVGSALVMALSIALESFFGQLNGNMSTEPMSILGRQPPASKAGVMNLLVLGSQTRDGQGPGFGRDPGTDLSDTAMLVHLNADHSRAIVLSVPRDLIVDRPSCRERTGGDATVSGAHGAMFDSAMNLGGPACAVATVEGMSGMRVDHFIRVDFNGFRTMTDLLGGVRVCVPRPGIHDWRSHLNISAGLHVITGNEALAFVRDRHGIGNGGDLGRIEMQQMFVSSLLKKVLDAGTLTNPVTMYQLANAATRSLDTDPGLGSVQALLGLGESLRSLQLHQITFVTLPTAPDPANADRLLPREPQAAQLWSLLRTDRPWTGHLPSAAPAMRSADAPAEAAADTAAGAEAAAARPASARPRGPASPHSGPGGSGHPGVQTRNAGDSICSGLPTPNTLGELGR